MTNAPESPTADHPLQQIHRDDDGVIRFRKNEIVSFLLDAGPNNLGVLAGMQFSDADWRQFAQLIGYSVSGYGDLSYASDASVKMADYEAGRISDSEAVTPTPTAQGGAPFDLIAFRELADLPREFDMHSQAMRDAADEIQRLRTMIHAVALWALVAEKRGHSWVTSPSLGGLDYVHLSKLARGLDCSAYEQH